MDTQSLGRLARPRLPLRSSWALIVAALAGAIPASPTATAQQQTAPPEAGAQEPQQQDPQPEATKHEALNFSGAEQLVFAASPRMDLTEGTIEMHLAIGWSGTLSHDPCVLSYGRNRENRLQGADKWNPGTRYAVHIGPDGKSIGLWNGTRWEDVLCDIEPGKYHHVALVTSDNHTAVIFDGELQGVIQIGYGTDVGSNLFVGSTGDLEDPLIGSLLQFRIWDRPLALQQIKALATLSDVPPELEVSQSLVASSRFTADESTVDFVTYDGPRTEELWRRLVPWQTDPRDALAEARRRGVPVLSYGAADTDTAGFRSVQRWLLGSALFLELSQSHALHLDERSGRSPGRFWILDASGRPISSRVCTTVSDLLRLTSDATVYQQLRLQPQEELSPTAAARLGMLKARALLHSTDEPIPPPTDKSVDDVTFDMVAALNSEIAMRNLLREYQTRDPLEQDVAPIRDNDPAVQAEWQKRALVLQESWLIAPPLDLQTYEFGFLMAGHLVELGDFEGAEEWLALVDQFADLDPMIGYRLAELRKLMVE